MEPLERFQWCRRVLKILFQISFQDSLGNGFKHRNGYYVLVIFYISAIFCYGVSIYKSSDNEVYMTIFLLVANLQVMYLTTQTVVYLNSKKRSVEAFDRQRIVVFL